MTNFESGKSKRRSTVGVRLPADAACRAVLAALDRPLLCATARLPDGGERGVVPDAARLADAYGPRGLAFVVDAGRRDAEPSTVVDLSGATAELVRLGKGAVDWLDLGEA